jgi:hypothetical protein
MQLRFQLTHHIRDELLIQNLINYLGCGNVCINREAVDFQVTKFPDLIDKILPLFQKYPVQGKTLGFFDLLK